jgi:hypothetical protein
MTRKEVRAVCHGFGACSAKHVRSNLQRVSSCGVRNDPIIGGSFPKFGNAAQSDPLVTDVIPDVAEYLTKFGVCFTAAPNPSHTVVRLWAHLSRPVPVSPDQSTECRYISDYFGRSGFPRCVSEPPSLTNRGALLTLRVLP